MSMTDLYHTEMLNNTAWKSGTWNAIPNYDEWKASNDAQMGATYNQDGTFTNPPVKKGIDIYNIGV